MFSIAFLFCLFSQTNIVQLNRPWKIGRRTIEELLILHFSLYSWKIQCYFGLKNVPCTQRYFWNFFLKLRTAKGEKLKTLS